MARRRIRCMIAVAAALMLISQREAFADSYPVRLPDGAPGLESVFVPDRFPDPHRAALMGANPVEDTSFAVSGARGSAALGAMFGALGALVNSAAIADANSERGSRLGSFLRTDVKALLRELTPASPQPSDSGAVFELTPMVVTKFNDDTHFTLECYVFAYVLSGERWGRGNFRSYGVGEFDLEQPDSLAAAAAALPSCVQEVYAAFAVYVDHRGEFVESARVRLEGAGPRTLHYQRTDDGQHVIFNFANLVRSYRVETVEFVDSGQ